MPRPLSIFLSSLVILGMIQLGCRVLAQSERLLAEGTKSMLRIDRKNQGFTLLETPSLAEVSISERYDLQEFISNSPDAFFQELGLELFLIGKEISPQRREVRQV